VTRATTDAHQLAGERLRAIDQRYTASRRALVEALARAARPVSVPELQRAVPTATSSLYRNLGVLEEGGVVVRVATMGDTGCYELSEDLAGHHHHLLCSGCGAVEDVVVPEAVERSLDRALGPIARRAGYALEHHRLDLIGRCRTCR
jgi:Fe2+ or Zn2+ uptake regulation protein